MTELLGITLIFLATILLAIPLGKLIAKIYAGDKNPTDFMSPLENIFYKAGGINPATEMTWQQHLAALLTINLVWFLWGMLVLMNQGWLPMNPDGNPSMSPDLAFNTTISFIVNCNLQHYSGESGVSYFSQLFALMFFQFVSAATGMAAAAAVFKSLTPNPSPKERGVAVPPLSAGAGGRPLGNFHVYFTRSLTRILLPVSVIVAVILVFNGTPMNFEGKADTISLQGDTVQVSRGPAAGFIAIKHVGTNGGGFFGVNSAHPLENPNYLTNTVEIIAQMIIPFAMVFALGFYLKRRKLAWTVFGVMTAGFLLLVIPTVISEINGSPAIEKMGIVQPTGAMEGKEVRFGPAASGFWSIATTVISTGSVNSMHDSSMPLSGAMQLLAMMTNCFYGGVGAGFLNFFVFIIIAVFISGLMVGRTPEFLGRKIEAREMKIATIIALLHPLLILAGTALASWLAARDADMGWWYANADGAGQKASAWLNNPGHHGFSEMLYEFTSSSANNGSGFEGLGDNNPFWNITTGIVLILGRYLPIIGPVAIAGIMANKKFIPESAGTLKTDTSTFGIMVFAVIVIIAALSFFPALTLGPLAELFGMGK